MYSCTQYERLVSLDGDVNNERLINLDKNKIAYAELVQYIKDCSCHHF